MLHIGELSDRTGVTTQTIRYYERIGLLPEPDRADNGYRLYDEKDVERLNFIRSARALDFALDDIEEILAFRERGEPPCSHVMNLMQVQIEAIEGRIQALENLRSDLRQLYQAGQEMPEDVEMKNCVCHLIEQMEIGAHED